MKMINRSLFLILSLLIIIGCNSKEEIPNTAVFCGEISNAKDSIVVLRHDNKIDTMILDSLGSFCFNIDITEGDYFTFSHAREVTTLFIEPADSIFLVLNTAEFDESILYSGIGADKNNYLAENFLEDEKGKVEIKELYSFSSDSFISFVDSVMKSESLVLIGNNFSQNFLNAEKAKILMENAVSKLNYPSYYEYFSDGKEAVITSDWYNFISSIDINNQVNKMAKEYDSYIGRLISYKADILMEGDSILKQRIHKSTASKLEIVNSLIDDLGMRNDLLYKYMKEQVMYSSINDLDLLINDFKAYCTDSTYIDNIATEINKWSKLTTGITAPMFTAIDLSGKEYSLKDFSGKYVYIDVWATWCSPCIREIPYLIKLEEEFKEKNIVFISISVDNTPDPWKKWFEERELHGLQLYAQNAWESSLAKEYLIRSIPRFLLIDREGKIIDVRAPRPSGNIKEVLNELEGID